MAIALTKLLKDADEDEPNYWDQLIAKKEQQVGFKICGARNRQGTPCTNIAGKATDHLGQGRCKFHGGRNQTASSKNWRHGKFSKIKSEHPELRKMMEELSVDHEVFNLENEILKLRAMIRILERDDLQTAAKIILDLSKVVERYFNIMEGRKYVISIENVSAMQQYVIDVINRHVIDPHLRHAIAQDLLKYRVSGPPLKAIEGQYEEVDD